MPWPRNSNRSLAFLSLSLSRACPSNQRLDRNSINSDEFDRTRFPCGVEAPNRVNKRDTRCTHDYNILVIFFSRVRNGPLREANDLFPPCAAQPAAHLLMLHALLIENRSSLLPARGPLLRVPVRAISPPIV